MAQLAFLLQPKQLKAIDETQTQIATLYGTTTLKEKHKTASLFRKGNENGNKKTKASTASTRLS
jgi:hypothetical protein